MVRVLVSLVERDLPALGVRREAGSGLFDPLERALHDAGMHVTDLRQATAADVIASGSSWASRLGIPERRPAWLLSATKPGARLQ